MFGGAALVLLGAGLIISQPSGAALSRRHRPQRPGRGRAARHRALHEAAVDVAWRTTHRPCRYEINATLSRVHAEGRIATGMLSAFGHSPTIVARDFSAAR